MIGIVAVMVGCADAGGETGETGDGNGLVWVKEEIVCSSEEPRTWSPEGERIAALHVWRLLRDPQTGDTLQSDSTAEVEGGIYGWATEDKRAELSCAGEYEIEYLITWAYWK